MNYANLLWSLDLPWLVFVVYWLVKGLKTRQTRRKEPFASRYGVMLILILGYL